MTALIFILVLAVLIFVHELGHFLAARLFGIRVDAFKIGFGPKIFAWRGKKKDGAPGETEYGVNLIPFGGFVKIFGENPDEASLDAKGPEAARSFVLKPRWQQAIVLAAGVLFNFIFAALLYVVVFSSGVTGTADGFVGYEQYFHDQRIMVSYVKPSSPADKAGLKLGDVVTGVQIAHATSSGAVQPLAVDSIIAAIRASKGAEVQFSYERGPSHVPGVATMTPVSNIISDMPSAYAVGIAMEVVTARLPIWISLWEGFKHTGVVMSDMVSQIFVLLSNAVVGEAHLSDVTGPVGIAVIVGDNAQLGLNYLLITVAFISINLGIVNLLPFPALDGGRIVFVAIEAILRRRVSTKFFNAINLVGFSLLMVLMVVVTWKDIMGLIWK